MITADQLVAHAVGDYLLQSHWMATEKTKQSLAAAVHALTYGLPFLFLRPSLAALAVIIGTHFLIDRWRLARFVVWGKNFLGPIRWRNHPAIWADIAVTSSNPPWSECSATGYSPDVPPWLAVWLLIIADNVMHVLINGLALAYL